MHTTVAPFNDESIIEAAAIIKGDGCVAVPTETVYGLAANALSGAAVATVYAAKGRPNFNPLIVHVATIDQAKAIGHFNDTALALAAKHWPGPLTIVVPLRDDASMPSITTAGLPTIALRVPDHRVMLALLQATGVPLAAPSANGSGTISPTRADHVMRTLAGRIPMVIDDGPTSGGIESTIVKIDGNVVRLLRHGPIVIGDALLPQKVSEIEAPGQLAAHYAPSKPLRLNALTANADEWWLGFGDVAGQANLSSASDLAEAASNLFDFLHAADRSAAARIAIAPIPETGLGLAINDRLRRAALGAS